MTYLLPTAYAFLGVDPIILHRKSTIKINIEETSPISKPGYKHYKIIRSNAAIAERGYPRLISLLLSIAATLDFGHFLADLDFVVPNK
jgi:hypothetical protein